ncbi:MAG: Ig-like domain-containing protein [Nitrospirota bacterium]
MTPAILSSLTVTPVNPSIASGKTRQFTAMGTFTDNSVQNVTASVAWSSTNTTVATISDAPGTKGLATSNNTGITGSTTIRATSGSISNSTTLRVTPVVLESISVTPATITGAKGTDIQFTATGIYTNGTTQNFTTSAIWNSSNTNVAFFNNIAGRMGIAVVTVNGGTTLITATMSGITSNAAVLTVP